MAHELAPGKFKPTVAHCLIRLLADKGLLLKLFTQNIDCLERKAGVPESLIVEAHGSFATQSCIQCRARFPEELMKQAIEDTEIPHCLGPQCGGLVKPDIVFFGEQLPETFHANRILCSRADLCIIMGTSLSVQPFASLPGMCPEGVPRVLINSERVGGLGSRADDVLVLGSCDDGAWQLADALGWEDELQKLCQTMSDLEKEEPRARKTEDEALQDEIAKITAEVDRSLKIGDAQKQWLEKHLEEKHLSNAPGTPELSLNFLGGGQLAEKSPREGGSQATVTKREGYGDGMQSVRAAELGNEDSPIRVKKEQTGAAEDDWEDVRDSSEAEVD